MSGEFSRYNSHAFHAPIRIYSTYRFVLAIIFMSSAISHANPLRSFTLSSTLTLALLYFVLATGFFIGALKKTLPLIKHTFIGFVVDVLFIATLEYTSFDQSVTLDLMLIVAVAAGSIVFIGKLGTALAAIATIFLCLKPFVLDQFTDENPDYFRITVLGITLFTTSWISQTLAKRLKESEGVTQQQAEDIEELQTLNSAIVARMRTGVVVVDKCLHVEMMNTAATKLLSTDPTQNIDTKHGLKKLREKIQSWLDNEHPIPAFQLAEQSPEVKLGFTFLGEKQRIIVFLEDNTKLKQHAQQLKLASLGQLAASIAHEVRNPIAAVSYASQLLQETQITKNQAHLLQIVLKHVERVNAIVSNVLEISSRKPPTTQTFSLMPWLDAFIANTLTDQQKKKCTVNASSDPIVDFDPSHLEQVLTNVIENAVEACHSEHDFKIDISVGYLDTLNRAYLTLHDSGPGINEQKASQVFEPFFTTSKKGSGLGLFLCREICELNHARIHLLPTPTGACFQILFKPRSIGD